MKKKSFKNKQKKGQIYFLIVQIVTGNRHGTFNFPWRECITSIIQVGRKVGVWNFSWQY